MLFNDNELPLLKLSEDQSISLDRSWFEEQVAIAAEKAGHKDWQLAAPVVDALMRYLRHRFSKDTISMDEIRERIVTALSLLETMGFDGIVSCLDLGVPPVTIELGDFVPESGWADEEAFFIELGEALRGACEGGPTRLRCRGLRRTAYRLAGGQRWTADCEQWVERISDFIPACLAELRPVGRLVVMVS